MTGVFHSGKAIEVFHLEVIGVFYSEKVIEAFHSEKVMEVFDSEKVIEVFHSEVIELSHSEVADQLTMEIEGFHLELAIGVFLLLKNVHLESRTEAIR